MNKKILVVIIVFIAIIFIAGISAYLYLDNDKNTTNSTENTVNITVNTTNSTENNVDNTKDVKSTKSNNKNVASENHPDGWKYKNGVWYDPNDQDTWYDANGEWQKMESDLTRDFAYQHSSENDVYYDSSGKQVSKEEYFNDPNIQWAN